jgi:hypothetical protein
MGAGRGIVNLNCKSKTWTNPNWQPGEIYSTQVTSCKPAELKITPPVVPFWPGNGGR